MYPALGLKLGARKVLGSVTASTRQSLPAGDYFLVSASAACWIAFGNNNVTAAANTADTAATGTLTNEVAFVEGDTVTIGGVTYTFMDALSTEPDVPYEVLIGANVAASHTNLAKAINDSGTEGTHYGVGTLIHPTVSASAGATSTVVTAKTPGTGGNAIATTEEGDDSSWGGEFLASGAAGVSTSAVFLPAGYVGVIARPSAYVTHIAAIRSTADGIVTITALE